MFASVPEKSCILLPILQPVYLSLVEILLVKVQYPNDSEYEPWCAGLSPCNIMELVWSP